MKARGGKPTLEEKNKMWSPELIESAEPSGEVEEAQTNEALANEAPPNEVSTDEVPVEDVPVKPERPKRRRTRNAAKDGNR
jgi:hypothetical protein